MTFREGYILSLEHQGLTHEQAVASHELVICIAGHMTGVPPPDYSLKEIQPGMEEDFLAAVKAGKSTARFAVRRSEEAFAE